MGRRRRIAWTEKPTERRPAGKASPTTANSVGLAKLVNHMMKRRPKKTNGQVGAAAMTT